MGDELDLSGFIGSTTLYRHTPQLVLTEGVKYLCDTAGAYWLADIVSSVQNQLTAPFQLWRVKLSGSEADVTCQEDSGLPHIYEQHVPWTDFPAQLSPFEFYVCEGADSEGRPYHCMMLKNEY